MVEREGGKGEIKGGRGEGHMRRKYKGVSLTKLKFLNPQRKITDWDIFIKVCHPNKSICTGNAPSHHGFFVQTGTNNYNHQMPYYRT